MRLHHLEATAFGPFPATVEVDFDRLSAAGLFLLSGPTGAGKSSVLDAVCFALYGDVPGDRSTAKRLRSDQAAPGAAPSVRLEATLSGRRFRIVRSAAWERPKKRGTGTTAEQARVLVQERIRGEWVTLTTRLDEAGHLMTRLVGMNLGQFTQVAMLPQGRFQAFLRARSEDRHQLLQQLFRTGRFEEVERWLRARRLTLREESQVFHRTTADLVSRCSEVVGVPLPPEWDLHDLTGPADAGTLRWWAEGVRATAEASRRDATATAATALAAEAAARTAVEAARRTEERRRRVHRALEEHDALSEAAPAVEAAAAALEADRRAAVVEPVRRLAAAAAQARDRAEQQLSSVRHEVQDPDLPEDRAGLVEAAESARTTLARVRAAAPRGRRLGAASRELAGLTARIEELDTRVAVVAARSEALPDEVAALRRGLEQARADVVQVGVLGAELREVEARLAAHRQRVVLTEQVAAARLALQEARAVTVAARERLLDLREARLAGMAAEIAGQLAVGGCCPVCGSAEHPHKATAGPEAPDAAAERSAQREVDDANATEHLRDVEVRDLTTRLVLATEQAGPSPVEELEAQRTSLGDRVDAAARSAAEAGDREAALDRAEAELAALVAELGSLTTERSSAQASHHALAAEVSSLDAEIRELLAGTGADSLDALERGQRRREQAVDRVVQALDALATATVAADDARRSLAAAAEEAGFADPDAAQAALLGPDQRADLERRVGEHERRLAAVTAVLAEPDARELREAPAVDVEALAAAHTAALDTLTASAGEETRWTTRVTRLDGLLVELDQTLRGWTPVRAELALTTGLSAFVEGKASDNQWQMRLSAYVLAYRLSQVVAAANERLGRMSDQRYSLEHTGRKGAGETRGGLSLLVRDDWSGESRDPATLSGGETFVVSLALALGLADVITREAGGADLDTLFVDEGFGSLDADTLDDVMDTLDSLRDGGRVVGVVSHVAEMRDRIPTRLLVAKSRSGSTLSQVP